MDAVAAQRAVFEALSQVAPEADLGFLGSDVEVAIELDLDSIDFLNVVTRLSQSIGVDIPERDYARLVTLDDFVSYVVDASTAATPPSP